MGLLNCIDSHQRKVTIMNARQKCQQVFEHSGQNLTVGREGDCPICPEQLALTTIDSPYVVEMFDSGLTAEVYRIRFENKDFTLKKKRQNSKVQNLDGQFSFLNEVQRRADFHALKIDGRTQPAFKGIVNTIYADYRLGIILSDWIEGASIDVLFADLLEQLFSTLIACERHGLFEWDLCAGNLLVDVHQQLKLFDFGYMYEFDPKRAFNSNGTSDPLFNFCERFETRFLSGWLLEKQYSQDENLAIFKEVKIAALNAVDKKLAWLQSDGGESHLIDYYRDIRQTFSDAISDCQSLKKSYLLTMFRSHVLDIEDDLEGKSCTPLTLKRIAVVLDTLKHHYQLLKDQGALFYQNEGQSQEDLRLRYEQKLRLAETFQL